MDHLDAATLGATEKYLLGTLDDAERAAFEEHFFDCPECAGDLRAAAAVAAGAHAPAGALTGARADPSPRPTPLGRWRRRLPRSTGTAAALVGLAASLCVVAYQGFVVIPGLRGQAGGSLQTLPSTFLTQSRSEAPRIAVGPGDRYVAVTLSRSWDRPFASYRVELRDAGGAVRLAETLPSRSAADELELLLPIAGLETGAYALLVEGADEGAPAQPAARYAFHLERAP